MLHGVLLIALFSCAAFYIGDMDFVKALSLSPMIVGIILGMLYANSLRNNLPDTWVPGIQFCSKRVLRIGIIFYGFRLTFQDVTAVGLPAILVDAIIVATTIGVGMAVGRLLKMDRGITLLTSVGSSICGAAAVLGTESTIRIKPYKTAVAVATVVIFGTLSMFLYPIAYRSGLIDLSPEAMGIFTGATVHEVAHVVGAGNAMGKAVADPANDKGDDAGAGFVYHRLFRCARCREWHWRLEQGKDSYTMVCGALPCGHRFQLVRLASRSRCRLHQHSRHIPAYNGNDGFGSRDEHRQIPQSRCQAFCSCPRIVCLAYFCRIWHGEISCAGNCLTLAPFPQTGMFRRLQ